MGKRQHLQEQGGIDPGIKRERFSATHGLGKDMTLETAREDQLFKFIENKLGFLVVKNHSSDVLRFYQQYKPKTNLAELTRLYQEAKKRESDFRESVGGKVLQQYIDPLSAPAIDMVGDSQPFNYSAMVAETMIGEELRGNIEAAVLGAIIEYYLDKEDLFKGLKKNIEQKYVAMPMEVQNIFFDHLPFYLKYRDKGSIRELRVIKAELELAGTLSGVYADPRLGFELNVINFLIQELKNRDIGHRFDDAQKPSKRSGRRGR